MKFIDINLSAKKPKATIHLSGKLGFNQEAIKLLDIPKNIFFKIGYNEELDNLTTIYLFPNKSEKSSAKITKAGEYYYLNVGDTFEKLKLDFKNNIVSFDIFEDKYENYKVFKLTNIRIEKRK